jgi:GT2 family glycosyltransferase
MSKVDYLRVGGWDENYELGMVADWDFFLKCQLSGLKMIRTYNCHFYHFVSLSTTTPEKIEHRRSSEAAGHEYARYKWGAYIKHNPQTNLKYV